MLDLCPLKPHHQSVIRSTAPINDEMAHQLYVLQVLTFNLLEDRMMTKMDPQDQVGTESWFQETLTHSRRKTLFSVREKSSESVRSAKAEGSGVFLRRGLRFKMAIHLPSAARLRTV